ncbi:hypothetical protein AJ80_09933 [Polytolypa hystricis UAMH7299]|uniref:Uncharacterized protein n=1 Tax=Polytolypa hystricis (strain UAMH7299) TaxID=1447883 RepID=A0A2B7WG95_POLH7|nr:hypothetical protein AJ80_09933 [Polytolypa hystricis UAMH7299]
MEDSTTGFFESTFKPRLEDNILKIQDPLPDSQKTLTNSWVKLCAETEESLKNRSSTQRSVRRRARYFARKVYDISPELFTLCCLSYTFSGLPKIPPGPFYDRLRQWWASKPHLEPLSKVTSNICSDLPWNRETIGPSSILSPLTGSRSAPKPLVTRRDLPLGQQRDIPGNAPSAGQYQNSSEGKDSEQTQERDHDPVGQTLSNLDEPGEPLSKRPRLESQVLRNPTLCGDGPFFSFSFMRRHMIEKLPEPFQIGIKSSMLWREELERGGLSVTNCLSLYLPEKINEDTLLVIRMGYYDGFNVANILGLGDPEGSADTEREDKHASPGIE